ncbi:MAG: FAD:protein FMN transferase [Candidatus Hydrogenedentes bacterium]|nr:FAD:protein FMN transferase [Candidatus Hydrogenedentota bacterium]
MDFYKGYNLLPTLLLVFTIFSFVIRADEVSGAPVRISFPAMGTEFEFILYPPEKDLLEEDVRNLCAPAIDVVYKLEKHISHYLEDNDLAKLNKSAGMGKLSINYDLFEAFSLSKIFWERTGGAFDPTVGPLLELWGFRGKERLEPPSETEINEVKKRVGFEKVRLDDKGYYVELTVPGMKVDFGGIGKGMALDRAGKILRDIGISRALLHSGTSSVLAIGSPPGQRGWKIGIRSPYNRKEEIESIEINDESLSTSSLSEQFLELNGKKVGHIFDPRVGKPVENNVLSVTVVAQSASETDALSTAFFVLGKEKTIEYVRKFPEVKVFLIMKGENGQLIKEYINFNKSEESL